MITFWIIIGILAVLFLFVRYFPIRRKILAEGVFSGRTHATNELFQGFPLKIYYFEQFCKNCMIRRRRPMEFFCNETVDMRAWRIGKEPQKGESVKLTIWKSLVGKWIIVQWTRTDYKIDPSILSEIKKQKYGEQDERFS